MKNQILSNLLADNPIAITGLGAFSAAGESVSDLWQASLHGKSSATWKEFPIGANQRKFAICAAPPLHAASNHLHPVRKMDRNIQMGWLAANQAWQQAKLEGFLCPTRVGVAVGTSRGPIGKLLESYSNLATKRLLPTQTADSTFAALTGVLAHNLKLNGSGATLSATCASAAFAIVFAAEQILLGKVDAMLVGGAEAPLQALILSQFASAGILGEHQDAGLTCRPFDISRNGMVLGEGSGFLVLESARSAGQRGVKPLAFLTGWCARLEDAGRTSLKESSQGHRGVMQEALDLAGISAAEIGYINAHGTGTKLNDEAEAKAFISLSGNAALPIPFGSTKPVTGHCLGTTPTLEAILCVESLRHQIIPPSANCLDPDPICRDGALTLIAQPSRIRHVMSNSLGFWGHHATLIFSEST